jgi:hypothetical protein
MRCMNLFAALVLFSLPGFAALAATSSNSSRTNVSAAVTPEKAHKIMERVVSQGYYRGGAYEEVQDDAGEPDFYVFQLLRRNAMGGESDVLGFIAISRKTGRIVEVDAEWCHQYPVHKDDKALKPYPGADLPLSCGDPALGE